MNMANLKIRRAKRMDGKTKELREGIWTNEVINATKRTDFKIWRLVTRRTRRRGLRSRAPNAGDE